jgi:capsid protein
MLEQLIEKISPATAYRRTKARAANEYMKKQATRWERSGYEIANSSRRRQQGAYYRSRIGSEEMIAMSPWDRIVCTLEAYDQYRNNEIVRGIVNRLSDYVIHTGINARSQTSDRDWNEAADAYFNEQFARVAYYRNDGTTLHDLQHMALVQRVLAGGLGLILLRNGQVQPVEYIRIQTPAKYATDSNVNSGIRYGSRGNVLGYYVTAIDKYGTPDLRDYDFIRREDFIHVRAPSFREQQVLGVGDIVPILPKLTDYDEADSYQLLRVKHDAMLFLKEKSELGGAGGLPAYRKYIQTDDDGNKQRIETRDWGMHWRGGPDDDLESFKSETPNAQYVPYLEWQLKTIGAALGMPHEYVMMIFTNGSFTAQRSANINFLHTCTRYHKWLTDGMMRRIRNWRVAKAIKEGDLPPAPLDDTGVSQWWKCDWSRPYIGMIDPEKEIKAFTSAWNAGVRSHKDFANSMDKQRDDIFAEKAEDIQRAIEIASAINERTPAASVTWRDIIATLNPGQSTAVAPAALPENGNAAE